jgi:hypothetical protein
MQRDLTGFKSSPAGIQCVGPDLHVRINETKQSVPRNNESYNLDTVNRLCHNIMMGVNHLKNWETIQLKTY